MHMKQFIKTFLFFLFFLTEANAQRMPQTFDREMIPPSPNAQILVQFGKIPVSLYTGTPDIEIPLFNIKLKDISIPISLKYDASGVKVEQEAARVGLGWNLNVGGVITHTIMGRYNDLFENVYFNGVDNKMKDLTGIHRFKKYTIGTYTSELPFTLPQGMSKERFYLYLANDGIWSDGIELSPDIFNYSFGKKAGKFIFLHDASIQKEKEDNVVVKPIFQDFGSIYQKLISWIIIDTDGTKYFFEQPENVSVSDTPRLNGGDYTEAFYLTKIETVNKTSIQFLYKKRNSILKTFVRTQNDHMFDYVDMMYRNYEIVTIDRINYPGGYITFHYDFNRQDLKYDAQLNSIENHTKLGKTSWYFQYGYFVSNFKSGEMPTLEWLQRVWGKDNTSCYDENWNKKRLKLLSATFSDGSSELKYGFTYIEDSLPTKLSAAQDHWGYFNGVKDNYSLVTIIRNESFKKPNKDLKTRGLSANREPSELYNQSFLLKEIIYPTGGKSAFWYEGNKFKTGIFENDPYKYDLMYKEEVVSMYENEDYQHFPSDYKHKQLVNMPKSDRVNPSLPVYVRAKGRMTSEYNPKTWGKRTMHLEIQDKEGNIFCHNMLDTTKIYLSSDRKYYEFDIDFPEVLRGDKEEYYLCVYGDLRHEIQSATYSVCFYISPKEYIKQNPVALGGGVRIKTILSYDKNDQCLSHRVYRYNYKETAGDTACSGKLMSYPRYVRTFGIWQDNNSSSTLSPFIKNHYSVVASNGIRGGNNFSVGYSCVNVYDVDSQNIPIGKSRYLFINKPDKMLDYSWQDLIPKENRGMKVKNDNPQGLGVYSFSENGTLLDESHYKYVHGSMKLLKKTSLKYGALGDGPMIVWGILKGPFISDGEVLEDFAVYPYDKNITDTPLGYIYPAIRPFTQTLNNKEEITYTDNDSLRKVTSYSYNDRFQPTRQTIEQNGVIKETISYTYPSDATNEMSLLLNKANRIDIPVERQTIRNNKTIHTKNHYSLFNSIPQINSVSLNSGDNGSMETRVEYKRYDTHGNPLWIVNEGNENVVYIWGYDYQYPVAEIKNATYDEVAQALGSDFEYYASQPVPNMAAINALRGKLKHSEVSTYTYASGIGMTSRTNSQGLTTFYEYDPMGRLTCIKDTEGHILQQFDYQYRQ